MVKSLSYSLLLLFNNLWKIYLVISKIEVAKFYTRNGSLNCVPLKITSREIKSKRKTDLIKTT
jgi:hypothetical protein